MFKLLIQDDEGKTTVVPLLRDEITIGRKEGNTIRLTERNVSRRHARILRNNGTVLLEDLDSYNGILVNGSRVQGRLALNESDRIQIGDYLIELQSEHAQAKPATGEGYEQRTAPIERVDPMAATPVPDMTPVAAGSGDAFAVARAPGATNTVFGMQASPVAARSLEDSNPNLAALQPTLPPTGVPAVTVPQPEGNARLVALSTNFAGQEFILDKPAIVIGRTDENDICVNHRSISRHHAKVVRENGRYAIVDLQSSNGVRVNGEEYGKVELRRGDVVDLGHVRLRFVEPGEDFLFGRDAQAVDISTDKKRRGALWAVLGIVIVGAIVGVVMVGRGGGDDGTQVAAAEGGASSGGGARTAASSGGERMASAAKPAEPTAPTGAEPTAAGSPPAGAEVKPTGAEPAAGGQPTGAAPSPGEPPMGAAPAPGEPPTGAQPAVAPPAGDVVAKLEQARSAIQEERWADAQEAAAEALKVDPGNQAAKDLDEQARSELKNQLQYGRFTEVVRKHEYESVAEQFNKIDRESVYRVKAQAEHDRARDEYVEKTGAEAERLASAGRCRDLATLERRARRAWPEAGQAVSEYSDQCKRVAVTAPPEPPSHPEEPAHAPTPPEPPPEPPPVTPTASAAPPSAVNCPQMIKDAKAAAKASMFGKALKLCEDVLDACKGDQEAMTVCAIASCNLKNESKARRYIKGLKSNDRRGMATQICLRNGVKVE